MHAYGNRIKMVEVGSDMHAYGIKAGSTQWGHNNTQQVDRRHQWGLPASDTCVLDAFHM